MVASRRTQHDRARVWQRVVAERGSGRLWREIAEHADLSERQCRRIYRAHMRSAPTLDEIAIANEVHDAIAFYDQAIEDLAILAEEATGMYVKIVAIKARINARARKMELLSIAGVFDNARVEMDVRAIASAVVRAFDEHNVPDDARCAVLAALEQHAPA